MKKEKEEELDKLFKGGMEDPVGEAVYREADWSAMEQLLDTDKKRAGIVYWLPRLGSVAALLLLAMGWWLYRPQVVKQSGSQARTYGVVKPKKESTGTSGGATAQTADSSKQKILPAGTYVANPVHPRSGKSANRSLPYSPPVGAAAALPVKSPGNDQIIANAVKDKKELSYADSKKENGNANNLASATAPPVEKKEEGTVEGKKDNGNANTLASATVPPADKKEVGTVDDKKDNGNANGLAATPAPKVKVKGASQPDLSSHAVFALSALASSDMNGVNSFQGSRVGGNFGALFSVNINKWTISTGGMYSIKPYQESFANYHTKFVFKTNPSNIGVNCRMIDIPLNVNYQVYSAHGNKITVGSGLSSYIILREDYTFNYANNTNGYGNSPYARNPAGYSVVNRNRNIFGVLNLDATYDHQINSRFGISFQPYVKLPFSNVGESQAKLQTAGVALGLSWNLNTFKKPN